MAISRVPFAVLSPIPLRPNYLYYTPVEGSIQEIARLAALMRATVEGASGRKYRRSSRPYSINRSPNRAHVHRAKVADVADAWHGKL